MANPAACNSTMTTAQKNSLCEVGDLSGKHGAMSGTVSTVYSDGNLPLYGTNSVVGRSVVIHDSSGARVSCANVVLSGSVKTVTATFSGPTVTGKIVLSQGAGYADTSVWVDLMQVRGVGGGGKWGAGVLL